MKKVLFLIHDLGPGGAEKVLVNLVNHMDRSRFDITLMSLFDEGVNKQSLSPEIRYLSAFPKAFPGNSRLMKAFSPRFLYKSLIREPYDILVSYLQGPCTRIIAGCSDPKIKKAAWVHTAFRNSSHASIGFRSLKEAESCYRVMDRVVFVSEGIREAFYHYYPNLPEGSVLYNTILRDEILQQASEPIKEPKPREGSFTWCSVGKLDEVKGQIHLLSVQKKLLEAGVPAELWIIGEGPLRGQLEENCRSLGIEDTVHLPGFRKNPYPYMKRAECYACSSLTEGFSSTAAEALILGLPICTYPVSGMREMLGSNNEYGIITEADENSLFRAVYSLASDAALRNHYRERAAERGKMFETQRTVRSVEDMLETL